MAHANARLTVHARLLLVQRVLGDGRPVSHVAKELGVSRQCAHRWIARFRTEGAAGLVDRSSCPRRVPGRTPATVEAGVLAARRELRVGRDRIAEVTGVPARTVSAILARHAMPRIHDLDPVTGVLVRASRTTALRYERPTAGDLIHVDVKKIGRIPAGGGWRLHGRAAGDTYEHKIAKIGFDYVHAAVDDHSRLAYAEILPDEKGSSTAAFLLRANHFFAGLGISVREVISDNHMSYRRSSDFRAAVAAIGAKQRFIKPHCPWQNGKVERFNRTLAQEWAYRQPFTSNDERTAALGPWLEHYNNARNHHGIGGKPPISRAQS